ncbi:MAG: thiosulfate oxidation carrier protein SoxY [Hyphomicrobium sp.]
MPKAPRIECLGRRQFVVGASVAAALLPVLLQARDAFGQDAAPAPNQASPAARARFDEIYAQLTKGAKPTEGKLAFEVPEIAENGNTVPFVITADSPMTADSHIKAIHLLSTENPQAGVATFRFTPESGKATVASRMRLAKSQDIVALAELSDGKLWVARTKVTVTIGGCGG